MKTFLYSTVLLWLMCFGAMSFAQENASKSGDDSKREGALRASDGKVLGALVVGSHEPMSLPQTQAQLPEEILEKLKKVFPYPYFHLLGMQDNTSVLRAYESWVVPSKDFFLKLDSKGLAPTGGLNLHLQLWQDKNVLVKTDVVLQESSPLFIGGPHWRKGQLVFVLLLK